MKSSDESSGQKYAILHKPVPQDWLTGEPVRDTVEVLRVRVPFHFRPVVESLPEENGKLVFSIREDQGFTIEQHPHEQLGWTVEYQARERADWCEAWITATAYQDMRKRDARASDPRYVATPEVPPYVKKFPAVNMMLEEALWCATELVEWQRREVRASALQGTVPMIEGTIRIRHQHSGNVIYADLFHK